MSRSGPPTLEQLYAETFSNFEREYKLYLATAGGSSGTGEAHKRHLLDTLYAITNAFEVLLILNDRRRQAAQLTCPFSAEGLEYYRTRYQLTDKQWQRVGEFFAELSALVGEDIVTHLQRKLRLPCLGCPVLHPLKP